MSSIQWPWDPKSTVRHGTHSGWTKHTKHGVRPCDACKAAKAAYDARRLSATDKQLMNRLTAKAQSRASTRLREAHPAVYRQLYLEEKAKLLKELEDE